MDLTPIGSSPNLPFPVTDKPEPALGPALVPTHRGVTMTTDAGFVLEGQYEVIGVSEAFDLEGLRVPAASAPTVHVDPPRP